MVEAPLRILVIADDPLIRTSLARMVSEQDGLDMAGTAAGDFGGPEIELFLPEVILWDLGWDPARSIERLNDIEEFSVPVVVLLPDENHLSLVTSPSAAGFLFRDASPKTIGAALQAAQNGLVTMDSRLAAKWRDVRIHAGEPQVKSLTSREYEVLELLAEGLPNKAIARRLGISDHTVKFHVNAILGKMGAQSRTDAVVRATRLGLLHL